MAEKDNLLVAPSIAKPNHLIGNGSRRESLGSSFNGDSPGRTSPRKLNNPNYKLDVASRYLRASIGSCHDCCKYGKRVTDEPKPWRTLPKRNRNPSVVVLVSKRPPVSVERKKIMSIKHMHATNAQFGGLNRSPDDVTVLDEPPEVIKREYLSSPKKVELSSKGSETAKVMLGTVMESLDTSTDDLPSVQPKVVPMQSARFEDRKGKLGRSTRKGDGKGVNSVLRSKSLSSVDASQLKLLSRRNSIIKDNKTLEPSKSPLNNVLAHSNSLNANAGRTKMPIKKTSSSKPKNEDLPFLKTVTVSNEEHKDGDNGAAAADDEEDKGERAEIESGPMDDKTTSLLSTNIINTKKNGKEIALANNITPTKRSGKEIVKVNLDRSQRKGVVVSQDKDSSLTELKFRRGRVVELQSGNSSPTKLKFRSAKVLINQDSKADVTKNLKMKAITNKVGVNSKSRKIALRHRGMEGKKDGQGLFNNVIEETASKLVKSRKSKVKALVGAFETVISLQDSKSAS